MAVSDDDGGDVWLWVAIGVVSGGLLAVGFLLWVAVCVLLLM